ncbi:MAG: DUF1285 domain-containing protein [Candidatus Pacebacteria bacterium]|nr:DUF1285 domain-containing protein [Candidatus Paceibacterota bacterium]
MMDNLFKSSPDQSLPPRRLPFDCGDLSMRIGVDGTWYYQNSPIGRMALVKLFASVLRREGDEYFLVTPAERGRIIVDDAPFVVVAMRSLGAGQDQQIFFTTSLGEEVRLDSDHPLSIRFKADGEPRPYILVRDNLMGLINRPVFYQLVDLALAQGDDGSKLGLWSCGEFFAFDGVD